jgi:transposase
MSDSAPPGELFPKTSPLVGTVVVNDRCVIRTKEGHRVVIAAGVPLAHYAVGDRMAEAHAMVCLVDQGWADQNDVARAFGCSVRTVRRHQCRYEEGGLAALGKPRGYPQGRPRRETSRLRHLQRLKSKGLSNREIASLLGVTENAIRKSLKRLGWTDPKPLQSDLPFLPAGADPKLSAFSKSPSETASAPNPPAAHPKLSAFPTEDLPFTSDRDPMNRFMDRLFACLGLLDDATPLFQTKERIPHAGLLLAIPAILQSGLLECARHIYSSIGPAFYGLRTTLVTLVLMALLRIKRPEGLKERAPQNLGRVLGLDRAPEVKTVRRKLIRLASFGKAAEFGRALAERRVAERGKALGFLYVDGHVRVYHGQKAIPKAHVPRMRLSMPATTDYWVNDREGDPLFVVTAEANAGLCRMLPGVLSEVRSLVGERRVTLVFDRGGWSPRLFQKMIAAGFDLMTYRKGRFRKVARSRFQEHAGQVGGQKVRYLLADQGVQFLKGALRLRQVTRLSEDGSHQTPIVTSRRDLRALEVARRMFERWKQENFFKYLREEFALDALMDYSVEDADPAREVPNPEWAAIDSKYRAKMEELKSLSAAYGLEALVNPEGRRRTIRGFKIANAELGRRLDEMMCQLRDLQKRRAKVPRRVPVAQTVQGPVVKLSTERKHLTNILKMVAYQAESDLVRMVAPHYRRATQEGRTLIQAALMSTADLEVTETELRVKLAEQSSPHRTRAIARLCEELNATPTAFPGTNLRLRFSVADPPP